MNDLSSKTERSYLDILSELHKSVLSDDIPQEEKALILNHIYSLEVMLEQYSA